VRLLALNLPPAHEQLIIQTVAIEVVAAVTEPVEWLGSTPRTEATGADASRRLWYVFHGFRGSCP
jgi:hypothetical protein